MTNFTWQTPPWQRNQDCTHMATVLTDTGDGNVAITSESVRGDNATEALADLLMGPGSAGGAILQNLVAVVIRSGIDVMWLAQPPISVTDAGDGEWNIAIDKPDGAEVTAFSASDTQEMLTRLRTAYSTK